MPNMSLAQAKLNSALLSSPETIKILGLGYDTPKCMYETLKDICPPCGLISVVCQRQVGKENMYLQDAWPSCCLSYRQIKEGKLIRLFCLVLWLEFYFSIVSVLGQVERLN